MEEINLAFETVIVGLLAIPWILILIHLPFYLFTRKSLLIKTRELLTDGHQSFALIGPLIIGLAYCAGTVIFPFADDHFNDPHRFPVYIRDDDAIRVDTLTNMYFDHDYYVLRADDFIGLAKADDIVKKVNELGPKAAKIKRLEDVDEKLYKELKEPIHSIYNYQKFYDYNSGNGYEVLKPLNSRIIVLRGAVLNGLLLLGALVLLFLVALLEAIRGRSRERIQGLVLVVVMLFVTWGLCWRGAWGVAQAEKEYDKHVVGIFYGSRASAGFEKTAEQSEGKNPEQPSKAKDPGKQTEKQEVKPASSP